MDMSDQERQELLSMYRLLRVADVRDGMDSYMMHHYGSMSPEIRPLWRTRAVGIARTARYLPFTGPMPKMTPEEYAEWSGWFYREVCTYPWMAAIQPGDFCVIDQSGANVGLLGSNNTLAGVAQGAVAYVTSGGVRDTDEIIRQEIPFWSRMCSQPMVQGRLQFDAMDVPVSVGGVTVCPGDIVVADGDGVIVVPRKPTNNPDQLMVGKLARNVAASAQRENTGDRAGRRKLYEKLGRPLDDTV